MQRRGIPLRLRDEDPSIGRYFPTSCAVQFLENGNLFVQFSGHGYAFSTATGRVGFEASAGVEYDHDFLVEEGSMYIYFRALRAAPPESSAPICRS
jgi:hypothetical protein